MDCRSEPKNALVGRHVPVAVGLPPPAVVGSAADQRNGPVLDGASGAATPGNGEGTGHAPVWGRLGRQGECVHDGRGQRDHGDDQGSYFLDV